MSALPWAFKLAGGQDKKTKHSLHLASMEPRPLILPEEMYNQAVKMKWITVDPLAFINNYRAVVRMIHDILGN